VYQATTITITVPTDIKTTRAVLKAFYVILTITGMMNCKKVNWYAKIMTVSTTFVHCT